MSLTDDLAHVADALGLRIPREDLERWAPMLIALFADLERLIDAPIDDREPAFVAARLIEAPAGERPEGSP